MPNRMTGLSLFASAGVAELNLSKYIDFVLANELLPVRGKVHEFWHPDTEMICGDITEDSIKKDIITKSAARGVNFILATPPCQGVSLIGKNKRNDQFVNDPRNFLIFHALEIVDAVSPDVVVIENVDRFAKMHFPHEGGMFSIEEILHMKYDGIYNIDCHVYNAADHGVPQTRKRLIIILCKDGYEFIRPSVAEKQVTVKEAIGDLPSLESGQDSGIRWHYSKVHNERDIAAMRHTPEGKSAFLNDVHYPKKADGERMKGFHNTFSRMRWDEPCPARTIQSGNMGGHNNCHPGRPLADGTYSDARVLTMRELFIVSSLPADWELPDNITDTFIRAVIGEAIPPRFSEAIIKGIGK